MAEPGSYGDRGADAVPYCGLGRADIEADADTDGVMTSGASYMGPDGMVGYVLLLDIARAWLAACRDADEVDVDDKVGTGCGRCGGGEPVKGGDFVSTSGLSSASPDASEKCVRAARPALGTGAGGGADAGAGTVLIDAGIVAWRTTGCCPGRTEGGRGGVRPAGRGGITISVDEPDDEECIIIGAAYGCVWLRDGGRIGGRDAIWSCVRLRVGVVAPVYAGRAPSSELRRVGPAGGLITGL